MNWYEAIGSLGFPIVVAMFVLVRLNGKFDRFITAQTKLIEAIQSLERVLNQHMTKDDVKAIIESYLHLDKKAPNDPYC